MRTYKTSGAITIEWDRDTITINVESCEQTHPTDKRTIATLITAGKPTVEQRLRGPIYDSDGALSAFDCKEGTLSRNPDGSWQLTPLKDA